MMEQVESLLKKYLAGANVMQLATSANGQPWVCTVHYYADDSFNLYWISTEARRHSVEIAQNPKVAAYILVHENTETEHYIIGISIEGTVELLGNRPDGTISKNYANKLHKPPQLMADIRDGTNPHKFYKLVPINIVLFDTKNFPKDPRQELNISNRET